MSNDVAAHILAALQQKFGGNPTLNDPVIELGVDSLGIAELLFELESRYGITVDEHVLAEATVGELADYVRARIRPKVGA